MKPISATKSRLTSALLLAGALLCGCATMSESDCRSADWSALGERDALVYGLRPQIDQYAHQCSKYGVQPSEKDYIAGWNYGYGIWSMRTGGRGM